MSGLNRNCPGCGHWPDATPDSTRAVFSAEHLRFTLVFGPDQPGRAFHEQSARIWADRVFYPFAFTLELDNGPRETPAGLWQSTWYAAHDWDEQASKPKLSAAAQMETAT